MYIVYLRNRIFLRSSDACVHRSLEDGHLMKLKQDLSKILSFISSSTQQNPYSISHLPDIVPATVTVLSLYSSPRHRDFWIATTLDTHAIRYPLQWGLFKLMYVEIFLQAYIVYSMERHWVPGYTQAVFHLCRT